MLPCKLTGASGIHHCHSVRPEFVCTFAPFQALAVVFSLDMYAPWLGSTSFDAVCPRCAQLVLHALEGVRPHGEVTVMEVGCGAGGASFELSKKVGESYLVML